MNAVPDMVNGFTFTDLRTQREFLMAAYGSVLVGGVGRGRFLERLVSKPNVDYVTVVEPDLQIIWEQERVLGAHAEKVTFVNCRMSDIVNRHVYDTVFE